MKTADMEVISGVIRVFPEEGSYGNKYEYIIYIRGISRDRVELLGITQAPTPSQWRAIRYCLLGMGVESACIKRFDKEGNPRLKEVF